MEVVADVRGCARVPQGVEVHYDVIEEAMGQLNAVEAHFSISALTAVGDLYEFDHLVRRVGDHQHGCGGVDGSLSTGAVMRRTDAFFDLPALVADLDQVDSESRDDLHTGHPARENEPADEGRRQSPRGNG
ncbi:hypothetical protein ACFY3M_35395 [Streptomyces mirabilis]|uniref:hypothetical protein n=1 Tax=Streptomyces mirabilis TaxID=68239 RepID=UPI0036A0C170